MNFRIFARNANIEPVSDRKAVVWSFPKIFQIGPFLRMLHEGVFSQDPAKNINQRCSMKKVLLKNPQNSQKNTYVWVSFLKRLQAWRLWRRCFPVNLGNFYHNFFHRIVNNPLLWMKVHLFSSKSSRIESHIRLYW